MKKENNSKKTPSKEKVSDADKRKVEDKSKKIDLYCKECAAYPCELSESGGSCSKLSDK